MFVYIILGWRKRRFLIWNYGSYTSYLLYTAAQTKGDERDEAIMFMEIFILKEGDTVVVYKEIEGSKSLNNHRTAFIPNQSLSATYVYG